MDDVFRSFCQSIIDTIKKNGFPEKKVALPLMQLYESADNKGLNFNKVLETLSSIEIDHKKTAERVIFFPKVKEPEPAPAVNPYEKLDLSKMNLEQMMSTAQRMMETMSPEQIASLKEMCDNMTDEERAQLVKQASDMGFFKKS